MNRKIIDAYAAQEKNKGILPDFNGIGCCEEPGCGDVMEFTFKSEREIITKVGYTISDSACIPMKACAAIAAELAIGKPVLEAYLISKDAIAEKAGGLEKEHIHCAIMAEISLKRSIVDYSKKGKVMAK